MKKSKTIFYMEVLASIFTFVSLSVIWSGSCSSIEPSRNVSPGNGKPIEACGGANLGTIRETTCQGGNVYDVCESTGWRERSNTCTDRPQPTNSPVPCNLVTWNDIKILYTENCVSCHPGYDRFDTAVANLDETLRRLRLPSSDQRKMPKNKTMSETDISKIEQWSEDGRKKECDNNTGNNGAYNLEYIENSILQDLNRTDQQTRLNTRYIISTNRLIASGNSIIPTVTKGINKAVNSVSTDRRIVSGATIEPTGTILKFDISALDLTRNEWEFILQNDPIKFISNTTTGRLIQVLTQTRQPWLHADNMMFIVNQPNVYYTLLQIPQSADALLQSIGVDYGNDFRDGTVRMLGFNGSPISINKNRAMSRHETDDGYLWITYDPIDPTGSAQRNLFNFPLLRVAGGQTQFIFDASEFIWTLPNGLQGYALFNSQGVRQNAAPLNIVNDTNTPFSPEIVNAFSCHRCHSTGVIASNDQILDHVNRNRREFNQQDVEIVELIYRSNTTNQALFGADRQSFSQALGRLGIGINDPDPINATLDLFRKDYRAIDVAGLLFLNEQEFLRGLEGSSAAGQIGQLLSGGTVTLAQLLEALPVLFRDLRIGQDRIQ